MRSHRRSVRLPGHDYRGGLYAVTICAFGRQRLFGRVLEGEMVLSALGEIARDEWVRTGDVRASVTLDVFVVMPDHVHLLFGIAEGVSDPNPPVGATRWVAHDDLCAGDDLETVVISNLEGHQNASPPSRATHRVAPTRDGGTLGAGSVGAIIGQYKSVVTRRIHALDATVRVWQRGFHDRVVRTDLEADGWRRYIAENPARWKPDAARRDGHRA